MVLRKGAVPDDSGGADIEIWADDDLGDGWKASFRLEWTGGEYVITELRVSQSRTKITLNLARGFPPDSLTARRLRELRIGPALREARKDLEASIAASPDPDEVYRVVNSWRRAHPIRQHERRRRWTDAEYVTLAARYIKKVRDDGVEAPVAELASEMNYSPARIRQALAYARNQGWLTQTQRGRAGGQLTDAGLTIAKNSED